MSSNRFSLWGAGLGLLALFLIFTVWSAHPHDPLNGFRIPDETKAAQTLLAEKLSGPRYFAIGPESPGVPFPYITPASATEQLGRIVNERHLDSGTETKLEALIDELIEPPFSRISGTERINALRLNLALDQLQTN